MDQKKEGNARTNPPTLFKKARGLSLRLQLTLVITLLMIPIMGIMLVLSVLFLKNAENRLSDYYANELSSYAERLVRADEAVQNEMNSFILEWEYSLSMSSNLSPLSVIYIVENLKDIWSTTDLVSGAYIRLREDGEVYLTYDNSLISYTSSEDLKSAIMAEESAASGRFSDPVVTEHGDVFLVWSTVYNGYDIGFFLPLNVISETLSSSGEDTVLYITTGEGALLLGPDLSDDIVSGALLDTDSIERNNKLFSSSLSFTDMVLYLSVPRSTISATVPFAVRALSFAGVMVLILIPVLWLTIDHLIVKPIRRLTGAMNEIEAEHMDYRLDWEKEPSRETRYMARSFNEMVQQIRDLRIEKYEIEIEKSRVETMNLKLQINPHLLLNSLNMVISLARLKDFDTIRRFCLSLSSYFRYALRNPDDLVALKDELSFVQSYLEIQKVRYPNTFTSVYDMEEDLEEVRIPSLVIENFVENSVKYALKADDIIEILIIVRKEGEYVVISVIDNGNGMSEETLEKLNAGEVVQDRMGDHIGIWNVRRRLRFHYKEDVTLTISSTQGEGTQVWMKIPARAPAAPGEEKNDASDRG